MLNQYDLFIKVSSFQKTEERKIFKEKTEFLSMDKGRKITGGRYSKNRKKKSYEIAGQKRIVKIGEEKRKIQKIRGKKEKNILLGAKFVNILGKNKKTEIKNVLETPSNRFLARQNILTKGTIVQTEFGRVRITNRPTQEAVVNGILIE